MFEEVPRMYIAVFPLLILLFAIIGGFIFVVTWWGKTKPAAIPLAVVGFVILVIGGVFALRFGVMLPIFVLPVLIGIGIAIFMIVKAGGGKAVLAISIAGVLMLLLLGGLYLSRSTHLVHRTRGVELPAPAAVEMGSPAIWHEGVEKELPADIYPSKRAAMFAVARRAAEEGSIQKILADECISRQILLLADDHDTGLLSELGDRIGELVGVEGVTCRFVQNVDKDNWDGASNDDSVSQLKLQIRFVFEDVVTDPSLWGGDVSSGKVTMQVKGPKSLSATTVRFAEKPWVENFPQFLSRNPDRQFLLIRSSDSCTSRAQADQQTLRQACSRISEVLKGMQPDPSVLPTDFSVSDNDLSSSGLIVDRFTQRFSGLAGPIWREAVLIDTSEDKLSALTVKKINFSRMKHENWARMALTLLGMFALICVVYMFLNAATRGYYSWALRIALVVLMGVSVFLVLMLA